ncbi:ankyrin repeat domain-containing protein 54 [Nematolebias whitei]|uniref:ankyrin repeat domain-containing protein 54 n=1 Tax=Nematolebias whitei TaxID=451745 RepID=UPI001897C7DC|nr:ankyrin repeat domain-containing protein 54 [Nematolebias whitei]
MEVVVSDNDRSSSEGEYEPRLESREAADGEAGRMMDDGPAAAAVGFGMSGTGEGKMVLGRVRPRDEKELRYLHLLWEPGRSELGPGGVTSKPGKITGSRARRQHRTVRNLGPIGKDIYAAKRLREAANSNDIDTVRKLLQDDIDPCAADDKGRTALHFSSCNGNDGIGRLVMNRTQQLHTGGPWRSTFLKDSYGE